MPKVPPVQSRAPEDWRTRIANRKPLTPEMVRRPSVQFAKKNALLAIEHLRRDLDYDYPASVVSEKRRMATRAIKTYEAIIRAR